MKWLTISLLLICCFPISAISQEQAEMKLTVLLDNNTLIDRYFLGEPGVSYLIETDGKKILFDVGYSILNVGRSSL